MRLAEFDLINSKTLIAHGLYISDADVELLNAQDGFLVHNARSNMNNHVGYNPACRRCAIWRSAPTASVPTCSRR